MFHIRYFLLKKTNYQSKKISKKRNKLFENWNNIVNWFQNINRENPVPDLHIHNHISRNKQMKSTKRPQSRKIKPNSKKKNTDQIKQQQKIKIWKKPKENYTRSENETFRRWTRRKEESRSSEVDSARSVAKERERDETTPLVVKHLRLYTRVGEVDSAKSLW